MRHTATSLLSVIRSRSQQQGSALAYRFLPDGTAGEAVDLTYGDLAGRIAAVARELDGAAGQRVLLAADPGLDYVAGLFGAMAAGATVVPSFPPAGRQATVRFLAILADCAPTVIVGSRWLAAEREKLEPWLHESARRARWLFLDDDFFEQSTQSADFTVREHELALLQYSSGSTGDPKGIMLSPSNIASNCRALQEHMGVVPGRVGCSWLPPYHDMGLMGGIMAPVYGGWPVVIFSPAHFVQRPYRWLKAITEYGVTISPAPNFALDMCVQSVSDSEVEELELGTLRQLYCGAEPLLKQTLDRFSERFARCGYRDSALVPCYGLAEATLLVSGKPDGTRHRSVRLDKAALAEGQARPAAGSAPATDVVSCGVAAPGHDVRIVDPDTFQPAGPGDLGEIWVSGPSVGAGYFGQAAASAAFAAQPRGERGPGYLRTGDLGFLLDGEIFVAGRLKEVIVINGRNLYPHDVEVSALTAHQDLRRAAAFSVQADDEAERLVVVAEFRRAGARTEADLAGIREAMVARVTAEHGVGPAAVHLGPPGTIPTTTSGKVRRAATRQAFQDGELRRLVAVRTRGTPRQAQTALSVPAPTMPAPTNTAPTTPAPTDAR
jgi:acyl-CoA synthetase (AMP-forming)/AMP-acid ligase II